MSYRALVACASLARGRNVAPAAAASARSRRKSRLSTSLIDRGGGIEQKRHEVLDLLRSKGAGGTESRHLAARGERLGVVDLRVHVSLHLRTVAALLSESAQAGPDGPERQLVRRQFVAVVAAAARVPGLVVPGHALAALRKALAALPVAHQTARGIRDRLLLVRFERAGERLGRTVMGPGANSLQPILVDAIHCCLAARVEIALQDLLHVGLRIAERRG